VLANRRAITRPRAIRRALAGVAALGCALALSWPAYADVTIPAGGSIGLDAGGLEAGCTDLIVLGTLHTNSAQVSNVRNLIIQNGELIDAGASSISVGGNWSNSGTFTAGGGQVDFSDICGVNPAAVTGNTTFNNVDFTSASGKTWQFASGSTQTVQGSLNIQGDVSDPLNFRSTTPGQQASIVLDGPHTAANLDVVDVAFFDPSMPSDIKPIPMLSPFGMLVLLLLLGATIIGTSSRRLRQKSTWGNRT
jgi:hypothetical protein